MKKISTMNAIELAQALDALSPRRLHRHSWLFIFLHALSSNIIFLAFGLWQQWKSPHTFSFILLLGIFGMLFIIMHFLSYRLHISGEDIVIDKGIFFKTTRHIPLANLHNVNLRRNLLHRWLEVAEVRLETAGSGGESEALLRVLALTEAQAIERYLLQKQHATHAAPLPQQPPLQPQENLLPLPHGELLRLGLSGNQGLGLFFVALFYWLDMQGNERSLQWLWQFFHQHWLSSLFNSWWKMALILLPSAWLMGKCLSLLSAYLNYSHFALFDSGGERIVQQRGLITQHSSHIRKSRIQVWRIQQNPSLRFFHRFRLVIDTAVMHNPNHTERGIRLLIPIADQANLQRLLKAWQLPFFTKIQSLAPSAWRRIWIGYLIQSALVCSLLALIFFVFFHNLSPKVALFLWLALMPLQLFAAYRRAVFAGWHCEHGYFFYRDGWLWRRWHIIALHNTQLIAIKHNFFDRRTHMATLIIDSMGTTASARPFQLRYLPENTARALANALLKQQSSI